jgi:thiosulfate/3-mercaptopyruvate sulfurtransferase
MTAYLVDAAELKADRRALIVDVRRHPAYEQGHIPRAVKLDIYEHHWPDTTRRGVRLFCWQMQEVMRRIGVTSSRRVVAVDDDSGMLAARMVWLLDWLGHPDAVLLDGGMAAWRRAGGKVTARPSRPRRSAWRARPDPSKMITLDRLRRGLGRLRVVDTRTPAEHEGAHVRAARGGTIPGAVLLPYTENLRGGRFKPPVALRAMYEAAGVRPGDDVALLCNGGYRSAHAYLALRMAGYPRVRNYYGSWQEWGNRPDVRVALGKR